MSEKNEKEGLSEEIAHAIWERSAMAEAYKIAQGRGLEEEKAIEAAQDIWNDAKIDEPLTEEGKAVRAIADKAVLDAQNGIPSPFMDKPQFDYNKYRDETTGVALPKAFSILAKYNIIAKMQESEEEKDAITDAYNACSMELFTLLNEHKVGLRDYKFFFECLVAAVRTLESLVDQQVMGHRSEIMSRLLDVRNPGNDKFDSGHATYAALVALLERTRKSTGDNLSDYFS